MALADHGMNTQNRLKALEVDTNLLKVTPINCLPLPLNPLQDQILKYTEKVLSHLQSLTKSFLNIKNSLISQVSDTNKENASQATPSSNLTFEKLSPYFKNQASNPQQVSKQITETIDSFNEFLKLYCPSTSFDVCLDLCSFQEGSISAGINTPLAFRDTSELKSPTLTFSKLPERFLARTNVKAKTQKYSIKVSGCNTSPGHHLKPPSMRTNLFSNFMDFSPVGKHFDDISPIGSLWTGGTFSSTYNRLINPVRKISEFTCEAETNDVEEPKDLSRRVGNCSGVANETDYRLKSIVNEAKSDKEMSTEFSIEIEEVKVEVQKPHLDENGNEMLLFGLNHDE